MLKPQIGHDIVGGSSDKGVESHRQMGFHVGAEGECNKVEMKRQEDLSPLTQILKHD